MKGFTLGLTFKQRQNATRKSPIAAVIIIIIIIIIIIVVAKLSGHTGAGKKTGSLVRQTKVE